MDINVSVSETHSSSESHLKAGSLLLNANDLNANPNDNYNVNSSNRSSLNNLSNTHIKQEQEIILNTNEQSETNNNNDLISDTPNPKVVEHLRGLAEAFAKRGEEVKRRISQPLQTSSEESVYTSHKSSLFEEEWMTNMDITRTNRKKSALKELWYKVRRRRLGVFEPQSTLFISWLFVVSLAFIYNAVVIFLRSVFSYETPKNRIIFFIFDYICDTIYIIDIIWFKMRLKFVVYGLWVEDISQTRKNYLKQRQFIWDCLSLLPLDLFYFKYGFDEPLLRLLRLNRLFKFQTFREFFTRLDAITSFPYVIRIVHTLIYKIYLIHLSTCAYYLVSWYEGFGSTPWTYNNQGNAYLRCFYFAFRTATSISGRMPKPSNELEWIYMVISWLMGIFVFAMLIGQIRDIVATATQNTTNYRDIMNQTVRYMRSLHLPHDLQKRVRRWLTYTWAQNKTFDENQILELLPLKMRTDLALSIHYKTLSRVDLFKDCDRCFIRELVLKFKPVLFLPGDYICRKDEIGHEMYVIDSGQVCVMDPKNSDNVLATLSEGSVFGEVSILGITGFNRRTADVRSQGYSNLFVLSKANLMETLRFYPEYQDTIKEKARKLIKGREPTEDHTKVEEIDVDSILNPVTRTPTPRMFQTVMQLVSTNPDSRINQLLSRSERSSLSSNTPMSPPTPSLSTLSKSSLSTLDVNAVEVANDVTGNPSLDLVQTFEENSDDSQNDDNKSAIDNHFINDIIYEF